MIKSQELPRAFLFLFFLAGAGALMFEILWQRMMVLTFGASPYATTAVLTALFCGISLGSWLGGKLLHRFNQSILFYFWTLLWIGLWGLLVPSLLNLMDVFQLNLYRAFHPDEPTFFAFRFLMAIFVLLPATFGMGATIPAMNRILTEWRGTIGSSVALAYGLNTFGAVLGSLLVGFVLIPQWGVRHSLHTATSLYGLVAIGLMLTMRHKNPLPIKVTDPSSPIKFKSNVLLVIYFFSGFLALGYETVWLRLLGIFNSNSIITFTLGLSVYLLGCSIGSLVLYPLLARRFNAFRLFILTNWGAGVLTLSLIPLYYYFPDIEILLQRIISPASHSEMYRLILKETLISLLMMFLPALFMGLAYPAVCDLVISDKKETDRRSGYIFSLGSQGSATGTVFTALVLIPSLDMVGALGFLCAASLGLALIILNLEPKWAEQRRPFLKWSSLVLMFIAGVYGLTGFPFIKNDHLKAYGSGWPFQGLHSQYFSPSFSLLRYRSGSSATISVQETIEGENAGRKLLVDDQPVAGTNLWEKTDAKMLAHLPLLLHPDPRRALTVGFGSGGTSWSMTRYGINVDCVEIEPEVIRSAYLFEEQNYNVLQEPNFQVIINDARNFLHLTDKRYDVISTDVTNLQYKQNSSLYTEEYFRLLKSRLADKGIAGAWVPLSSISDYEYKILLKTFQSVFPHTSVWFVDRSPWAFYAILIGTPGMLEIDYARLKQILSNPSISSDLAQIGFMEPDDIIFSLLLDEDAVRNYTGNVPLHTDDTPILEFHTTGSLYSKRVELNSLLNSIPNGFLPKAKNIPPERWKALSERFLQNTQPSAD